MTKAIDLKGKRIGRLVVIKEAGRNKWSQVRWLCICNCGESVVVDSGKLRRKHTQSCGCLHKDATSQARKTHGHTSEGLTTREYVTWCSMKGRCSNPNNKSYEDYGGRGIQVCKRWQGKRGFQNFLADMGTKPADMSLDRMRNGGDYKPSNCRWTTKSVQMMNRRPRSEWKFTRVA